MENTQKMKVSEFLLLNTKRISKFVWVLMLLLPIGILVFLKFHGGQPELNRLF